MYLCFLAEQLQVYQNKKMKWAALWNSQNQSQQHNVLPDHYTTQLSKLNRIGAVGYPSNLADPAEGFKPPFQITRQLPFEKEPR